MAKAKNPDACLNGSIHHYEQIVDRSITAHTIGQFPGLQFAAPPKEFRYICIQCGKVIKV